VPTDMPRKTIAIIAAMEREVKPLIRRWKMRMIERDGRRYRLFENGGAVLICGGIGADAARRATEAVIEEVHPSRVISAGFAGALDPSVQIGHYFEPREVINAADGVHTDVGSGDGILVSATTVAGKEQKVRFRKVYGASAVDMEAAAVAQGALARGIEFAALKAISDAADFDLPPVDAFVAGDGSFRSAGFAFHVVLRPWLWRTTISLVRNSSKANRALCAAIENYLGRQIGGSGTPVLESLAATLNPKKDGLEFAGAHTGTGTQPHTLADGE
jgi:adenosylhomocysteine nucleosidase